MGPTLLLDKSVFQSLSHQEHETLRSFFIPGLHPLLADEVLADLSKEFIDTERSPEAHVVTLARKFFGSGPPVLVDHITALEGSLVGDDPPMTGQLIVRDDERSVTHLNIGGSPGFVLGLQELNHDLTRWKRGAFTESEKHRAAFWREKTTSLTHFQFRRLLDERGVAFRKAKSLEEAFAIADTESKRLEFQTTMFDWLTGSTIDGSSFIPFARRRLAHFKYLKDSSRYAYHCARIMLFFEVVTRSGLLGWKPTNAIDIRHLFYLPFCNVFTSGDRLHLKLAPFLLRKNQCFIPAKALKPDLKALANRIATGERPQLALHNHYKENKTSPVAEAFIRSLRADLTKPPEAPMVRSAADDAEILKLFHEAMKQHGEKTRPGPT